MISEKTELFIPDDLCRNMFASVQCAMIITDPRGVILAANPRVRDIFGYTPEALKGKNISILFTPEDQDFLFPNLLYLADSCEVHQDEIMLLRRNKARFFAGIRLCGYRGYDQALNVFSIIDHDKAKKMEKAFHDIGYHDLVMLANGVAHEIRNPLMGIGGFLRKLRRSTAASVESKECFEHIDANLKKIESIVEKVEFFAGLPLPSPELVRLKEVIQEVVDTHRDVFQTGECFISIEADDVEVMVDPVLIKRALAILMDNSLDACPGSTKIKISARVEGDFCQIKIQDNGLGISSRDLPYIFHPFFSTKDEGAGIDLAIFKRIIENHNGKISVESEEGAGTTFTVRIPLERRKKIRTSLFKQ